MSRSGSSSWRHLATDQYICRCTLERTGSKVPLTRDQHEAHVEEMIRKWKENEEAIFRVPFTDEEIMYLKVPPAVFKELQVHRYSGRSCPACGQQGSSPTQHFRDVIREEKQRWLQLGKLTLGTGASSSSGSNSVNSNSHSNKRGRSRSRSPSPVRRGAGPRPTVTLRSDRPLNAEELLLLVAEEEEKLPLDEILGAESTAGAD